MPDLSIQGERRRRVGLRRYLPKYVAKIRLYLQQNALESHIAPSVLQGWARDISRFVPVLDPAEYRKAPINGDWTALNVLTQVSVIVHTWENVTVSPSMDQMLGWFDLLEQSSRWSYETHPVFRRIFKRARIAARGAVGQRMPS